MRRVVVRETSDIDSIVEFSHMNPWKPQYPSNLVKDEESAEIQMIEKFKCYRKQIIISSKI